MATTLSFTLCLLQRCIFKWFWNMHGVQIISPYACVGSICSLPTRSKVGRPSLGCTGCRTAQGSDTQEYRLPCCAAIHFRVLESFQNLASWAEFVASSPLWDGQIDGQAIPWLRLNGRTWDKCGTWRCLPLLALPPTGSLIDWSSPSCSLFQIGSPDWRLNHQFFP